MKRGLSNVSLPWDLAHPWADADKGFGARGDWPARWIRCPSPSEPLVAAYRLAFEADQEGTVKFYASGDERYELFLDGVRIGRGPERGAPERWYYDGYACDLDVGQHVLVARVWSLGIGLAPWSTLHVRHGFLLAADDLEWNSRLATGVADWRCAVLPGYTFKGAGGTAWASNEIISGPEFAWGCERGEGCDWQAPEVLAPGRS